MRLKKMDMSPDDIRDALRRAGITQSGIARDLKLNPSTINRVIEGATSHRVMKAISQATGISLQRLRPSIYVIEGGPRKPGRPMGKGFKDQEVAQYSKGLGGSNGHH